LKNVQTPGWGNSENYGRYRTFHTCYLFPVGPGRVGVDRCVGVKLYAVAVVELPAVGNAAPEDAADGVVLPVVPALPAPETKRKSEASVRETI